MTKSRIEASVLFLTGEPFRPGRIDVGVEDLLIARLGWVRHPEGDSVGGSADVPQLDAILELVARGALPEVRALRRG